jgi:polar amino acid transport system substrate-binding protein
MEVDNGYVARPGAPLTSAEEVDRPGIKIAVAQGSAPHTVLRRLIKNAEIVPVPGGFEPAREALATGNADVYGENLHLAHRIADALPGARVLPGRFNVVEMAIGVRNRSSARAHEQCPAVATICPYIVAARAQAEGVRAGLRKVL